MGTKIFWSPEFFDRDYGQKVHPTKIQQTGMRKNWWSCWWRFKVGFSLLQVSCWLMRNQFSVDLTYGSLIDFWKIEHIGTKLYPQKVRLWWTSEEDHPPGLFQILAGMLHRYAVCCSKHALKCTSVAKHMHCEQMRHWYTPWHGYKWVYVITIPIVGW